MEQSSRGSSSRRSPEELGFDPGRLARLSSVADRYIDAGSVAGVVTAVLRDGAIAWLEARGRREIDSGAPMATDTLFRIYSMTKPITSAAVMILVEEAKLRLTDPLSRYFPEYRDMEAYVGGLEPPFRTEAATREIAVRDLLTHTAGLGYGIGDEHPLEKQVQAELWETVARDRRLTLRRFAELVADLPLVHQPGTHYRYSLAIDLLGALVEEVSGMPLARFLEERLFAPLGMEDTFFTVPESKRGRLAGVYARGDGGLEPVPDPPLLAYTEPDAHPNGGGGLVSTACDYLSFAQMLLNGGRAPSGDGRPGARVLGPRTVAMMMTDHLPPRVPGWSSPGAGFGYGGKVVTDVTQLPEYGSAGRFSWGGAASTLFWVDPAERLAIVVLYQIMPYVDDLSLDLYTTVYQAIER